MEERDISREIEGMVAQFEGLEGSKELEFLRVILEKMENGEVEQDGKTVYPRDIGIEDGYGCCGEILRLVAV